MTDESKHEERMRALANELERREGPFDPRFLDALARVPRNKFVRPNDLARAEEDTPLPLDDSGLSTISAPHAYLLTFRALDLVEGEEFLELGSGSGYGAALAAEIVGGRGHVTTIEIDDALASLASKNLADRSNVDVKHGDAAAEFGDLWKRADAIACTFAIERIPPEWLAGLHEGARLAAPVGPVGEDQWLVRAERRGGEIVIAPKTRVRYVRNRSTSGARDDTK